MLRHVVRRALGRRERVVPVVTRGTRQAWRQAAPDDWASRLHLLYLDHRDRVQPGYFARSGPYPMPRRGLPRAWRWWVADVAVQSLRLVRRHGRRVREVTGLPVRRQLWDLLRLSVTLPAKPATYYTFEWYRPENRARARQYLHRHETKGGLYEMLGDASSLGAVAPLTDKVAFAAHARRAGLPVIDTVAVITQSRSQRHADELPKVDLFVKPVAGRGGKGAQRWRYSPDTDSFRLAEGPVEVRRERVLDRLAAGAGGQTLVVQPCLTNHPELADLALDAVATCRVITILDEAGEPEPVISTFRMAAVRESVVDNMHRGGLAAPVDIEFGVLGAASCYAVTPASRHTRHPVSGAAIAGRKLPLWDDVRELAVAAHRAFRPRVLVGWDISIGPTGPVLIEGNEQPGVDGLQRLHDTPLGSHRFGELLALHLSGSAFSEAADGAPEAIVRRW